MEKTKQYLGLIALVLVLYTEGVFAQTYGFQLLNGTSMVIQSGTTLTLANNLGVKIDGVNSSLNNNGTVAMEGAFLNQNSGVVQGGTYRIGGAFTNTATFVPIGTTVELNGTNASTINATSAFNNLTINKGVANPIVNLATGLSINGTLNFTSGFLQTNAFTISIAATGAITGFDATKFIIINGLGVLNQTVSASKTYPVGTSSSSYTPLSITQTGTPVKLTVRVNNQIGLNPNTNLAYFTTGVVNKTWTIGAPDAPITKNLSLTAQWRATDELAGFNRAACSIIQWNNAASVWNSPSATVGSSTGSNPYFFIRSGLTSVGFFTVSSNSSSLPLMLLDFIATADKQSAYLTWTTSEEHNLSHFDIEKSLDGKNFIKITETKANNTLPTNRDKLSVYSALDAQFLASSYYRLRINDLDGTATYSNIIYLEQKSNNPIKIRRDTEGSVLIETDDKIDLITVTNTVGQLIKSTKDKHFLINDFNTGIYIISVKTNKGYLSKKIFKD